MDQMFCLCVMQSSVQDHQANVGFNPFSVRIFIQFCGIIIFLLSNLLVDAKIYPSFAMCNTFFWSRIFFFTWNFRNYHVYFKFYKMCSLTPFFLLYWRSSTYEQCLRHKYLLHFCSCIPSPFPVIFYYLIVLPCKPRF